MRTICLILFAFFVFSCVEGQRRRRRSPRSALSALDTPRLNQGPARFNMLGMGFTYLEGALPPCTHLRIWDSGATWNKIHKGPNEYDWSVLDAQVDRAQGKYITYVIGSTPTWAAKAVQPHYKDWVGGPGSNSVPRNMADFTNFVQQLAQRYKGRIRAYEVWNEPQLVEFFFPYSDIPTLVGMTVAARNVIRRIDPNALVLSASIIPRPSSGGMRKASLYLRELARHNWPVDGISAHIYPESGRGADRWLELARDMMSTLRRLGTPTRLMRRVWVTETLFGLLGDAPADMATTVRDMYNGAKQLGITQIYWYAWNRPDLKGSLLADGSPTFTAIMQNQ